MSETRSVGENNNRRRRVCNDLACGHRFTTIETVVESSTKHVETVVMIIPKNAAREMRAAIALLDRGLAGELSQNGNRERPSAELTGTEPGDDHAAIE